MSFEINKFICAVLTGILLFLLSSFIAELLYHPEKKIKNLSYFIENNDTKEKEIVSEKFEEKILTNQEIEEKIVSADSNAGEKFVNKNCASCHKFSLPKKNKIGPSLAILLNRKIGSLEDYTYSKSLKENEGKWDYSSLYYFLKAPKKWAPGTKMSYKGIKKDEVLNNVVKYIATNSVKNEN